MDVIYFPFFKKEKEEVGVRTMIIDKKSSFWLWRQTVTLSFNETIAFLWAKSSIWMWHGLGFFCFKSIVHMHGAIVVP